MLINSVRCPSRDVSLQIQYAVTLFQQSHPDLVAAVFADRHQQWSIVGRDANGSLHVEE
jgi:hypothetical protein